MPKTNLKTIAYHAIRQKIISCDYAPGTFLNEELLTAELGLSRTPVRDALSRLEQEGLLMIKPKRGITVKPLTGDDMNMIFEIRSLYEPYILRRYGQLIPKAYLKEYYEIFSGARPDSERLRDNEQFYALDDSFHRIITDTCPNIYIQRSLSLIQAQNERFRHMTGRTSDCRLEETLREHLDILKPCLQNDWETASRMLLSHLEASKKASFQLIFDGQIEL